ncbi:MAG: hypothetical protein ACK41T_00675 [Pseudobdellovibrio sp.]
MTTWGEIKQEIEHELDLSEESWLNENDLINFANSAISDIEKEIHTIHDNYFDSEAIVELEHGESLYSLPEDIYANKITGIFYNDGIEKYEVLELKDRKRILNIHDNDVYSYRVVNTLADGSKIKLYPASRVTSLTAMIVSYRRKAKLFSSDEDQLDIPEAKDFIKQFIKDQVVNKERATPDAPESAQLARKRKLLLDSLENMIDDDNTEISVNYSFYEEFV